MLAPEQKITLHVWALQTQLFFDGRVARLRKRATWFELSWKSRLKPLVFGQWPCLASMVLLEKRKGRQLHDSCGESATEC